MSTPLQTVSYMRTTGSAMSGETDLPRVAQGVYDRNLLKRAQPALLHQRFGQQKPLSQRSGQQMVFRRYEKLAQATTPLSDGVTPSGTALSKTDYVATVYQYGNWMTVTDWVDLTHVDPVINEASNVLGENMGETMDSVYREILVAGTSVYCVEDDDGGTFATGTTRTNCAGTLCKSVIDAVIRELRGADAKPFTPIVAGSTKVNTYPIGEAYWCLIHTDQEHDLFSANGGLTLGEDFTPVERYASISGIMETEVGKYRNVRFVMTTNAKVFEDAGAAVGTDGMKSTSGTSNDVYVSLFFARDAYGIVPLQRGSAGVFVERAGGNADPLRQRHTVAWKSAGTAVILNDAWMYRVECTSLD